MQDYNRAKGNKPRPAKKPDAPKLTPHGFMGTVSTTGFSGIHSESIVVTVTGQGRTHCITYHHPIGITELEDKVYVVTPSDDVGLLEFRKDDPRRIPIYAKREKGYAGKYAATAAELAIVNDRLVIQDGNVDVFRTVTEWTSFAKKEWRVRNPVPTHTPEELAKPKAQRRRLIPLSMPKEFPESLAAEAPGENPARCYAHIHAFNEWKKAAGSAAAITEVDTANPFPEYTTGGGLSGDRPQQVAGILANQKHGPGPCMDSLLALLMKGVAAGADAQE